MLTYTDRYWELCGRVSETSISMIFMRGTEGLGAEGLTNDHWSTYDPPHTSTYEDLSGGNTQKKQKMRRREDKEERESLERKHGVD
jgi:hypothetical protein